MSINLAIDDRLILEAQRLGCHCTEKETVTVALGEFIQGPKQQQIIRQERLSRLLWTL